jgi:hypothetical protein
MDLFQHYLDVLFGKQQIEHEKSLRINIGFALYEYFREPPLETKKKAKTRAIP